MTAIILFALAVGNKPRGLKLALYSEERLNNSLNERLSENLLAKIERNKQVIRFVSMVQKLYFWLLIFGI